MQNSQRVIPAASISDGKDTLNEDPARREEILKSLEIFVGRLKGYTPKIGVFGVTGVGKSTLCNALFGSQITKVNDVHACTREPQEILLRSGDGGIVLIDVPGVGENSSKDDEYFALYKSLSTKLDLIIWVIKADDRSYSIAEKVYNEILVPNIEECPVFFVVNQVDKINPIREWNREANRPGPKQQENIYEKEKSVMSSFKIDATRLSSVSSEELFNIAETLEKIIDVVPNSKKYALFREAREKTEKMKEQASKGLWQSVKTWIAENYAAHREELKVWQKQH